jgi:hypothetical protein
MTAFILGIRTPAQHNFDARVSEGRAKQARELAIAVPDKEPRPAVAVLKV